MACVYTYMGKTYSQEEFSAVLAAMEPTDAAPFMPGVVVIPALPFTTKTEAWSSLVLKRILRMASEGDYDGVAWTPGVIQAERYASDLRGKVDKIGWWSQPNGDRVVNVTKGESSVFAATVHPDGTLAQSVTLTDGNTATTLAQVIGKDNAARVVTDVEGSLTGPDLTVGAEGMKGFYDQMLPSIAQKLTKKWGGRVGETTVATAPSASRLGEERAHYLPLTPQIRNAVLYEGQPLFHRDAGVVKGSIEPAAARWLIRYFQTADIDTLLHENAHLMRFVMGDDWVDQLSTFLRSEPDPARPGKLRLTREGEEQFAELLTRALRWKLAPRGRLGALVARFTDMLADFRMRTRGDVQTRFDKWFDATLDPAHPLRREAIAVVDERLHPGANPEVAVDEDAFIRAEEELVKRTGQVRAWEAVPLTPGELRHALGVRASATDIDVMDVVGRATSLVVGTHARRSFGFGEVVRLTRRTVVPVEREKEVLQASRDTLRTVLGGDVPVSTTDVTLSPVQAASMRALVDNLADTGLGSVLPGRLFDPAADFSTLSLDEYNAIVEAVVDNSAGPLARRDRKAEQVAQNAAVGLVRMALDYAEGIPALKETVIKPMQDWFVVHHVIDEYASPAVREVWEKTGRRLGDISAWVRREMIRVKRAQPGADASELLHGIAAALPRGVVDTIDVDVLRTLAKGWTAPEADGAALDTLLAQLPDVRHIFGRSRFAGRPGATDLEIQALGWLDNFGRTAPRLPTGEIDPTHLASVSLELSNALGAVSDGLRRRWQSVLDDAKEVVTGFSGSPDLSPLAGDTLDAQAVLSATVYKLWHDGEWNTILSDVMHGKGRATTPLSGYDPGAAALAAITRLRGRAVLGEFAEEMLQLGIPIRMDDPIRAGRDFTELPMLGANSLTRAAYREDVLHYIKAIVGWNETDVVRLDKTGPVMKPVGRDPSTGMKAPSGSINLQAYGDAHKIVSAWGHKYGKDTTWKAVVLPGGEEVFVPEMLWTELTSVFERSAKAGLAWTERGEGRTGQMIGRLDEWAKKSSKVQGEGTFANGVNHFVVGLVDGYDLTLGQIRVGLTTGIGLPNFPYFVGNAVGGFLQAYQGKGLIGTGRMLGRFANPLSADGRVLRGMWLRMFNDGAGTWWVPENAVAVGTYGEVFTSESLVREVHSAGLISSLPKAESTVKLVQDIRDNAGTWWTRVQKDTKLGNAWLAAKGTAGAVIGGAAAGPVGAVIGGAIGLNSKWWQNMLLEAGTAIDNLYRSAAYVDERMAGRAPAEAAEIARRLAFDYGKLTDVERDVLRRTIMFYSFARRNTDLFWWTAFHHPSRIAGQLRGIRSLQQEAMGDDSEVMWPEYMDLRAIVALRKSVDEKQMSDAKQGIAVILPNLPIADHLGWWTDILGTLNAEPDSVREILARLTPQLQAIPVLGFGVDAWSGRDLQAYNSVPAFLVALDRELTGGVLVDDVLRVRSVQHRDPASEATPGGPRWEAQGQGARWWWVLRSLVAIPPFGRSTDTITQMQRADWGQSLVGEGGFTGNVMEAGRDYRLESEATRYVDPLFALARGPMDWLPGVDTDAPAYIEDAVVGDTETARPGLDESMELWSVFGVRHVPVSTQAAEVDRLESERLRKTKEALRAVEKDATIYR